MEFLQQVGTRLYEIRKEMKLNQAQMGEIIGVSRASYSLYENGKLPIDVVMLNRLHEKTGFSFDYLLGYSEEKFQGIPMNITVTHGDPPPKRDDEYEIVLSPDEFFAGQGSRTIDFKNLIQKMIEEEFKNREAKK